MRNGPIFLLIFLMVAGYAYAGPGHRGVAAYPEEMESRFYRTVQLVIDNGKELGLSDEQTAKLKKLSTDVQKEMIRRDAGIKTLKVEIDTFMWESPFDQDSINNLVAERHHLEHEKDVYILSSFTKLNNILNEEQRSKVNDL